MTIQQVHLTALSAYGKLKMNSWLMTTNEPLHLFTQGSFQVDKCFSSLCYMPTLLTVNNI